MPSAPPRAKSRSVKLGKHFDSFVLPHPKMRMPCPRQKKTKTPKAWQLGKGARMSSKRRAAAGLLQRWRGAGTNRATAQRQLGTDVRACAPGRTLHVTKLFESAARSVQLRLSGSSWSRTSWPWPVAAAATLAATIMHDDEAAAEGVVPASDYRDLAGVWEQDKSLCESMDTFLREGLGFPWFVSAIADGVQTTLKITFPEDAPGTCEIVDKTLFGRNQTTVVLGGPEYEHHPKLCHYATFMLSAFLQDIADSTVVSARSSVWPISVNESAAVPSILYMCMPWGGACARTFSHVPE